MMKRLIKIIIFLIFAGLFFWLVDFNSLEFKSYQPEPKQENASSEAPIIRNERIEEYVSIDRNFEGAIDDIIALANEVREKEGKNLLARNEKLVLSAMAKAEDMKEKGYFEHVSPEGLQPWFFAEKFDYEYKNFGENLAEGFFSAQEVHDAWMNSEGHRENIMSDKFEEIGVAILDFEQNGLRSYLVVQHFGTQLKKEDLEPQIICHKKTKKLCEDAEEKYEEVKDAIEKQEDFIKEAKKDGATDEDLEEMEENLEKLKKIKKDLKDYLGDCDEFIKKCTIWK